MQRAFRSKRSASGPQRRKLRAKDDYEREYLQSLWRNDNLTNDLVSFGKVFQKGKSTQYKIVQSFFAAKKKTFTCVK